jgi:hypothetical protein
MIEFQPSVRSLLLGCILLTGASNGALADKGDDVPSRLRTAREKFAELNEVMVAYAERSELAEALLQKEQERSELETIVRFMHIQVDDLPPRHRRNNLQEEFFQEWLMPWEQLTGTDRVLADLRSRMKQDVSPGRPRRRVLAARHPPTIHGSLQTVLRRQTELRKDDSQTPLQEPDEMTLLRLVCQRGPDVFERS